tara:strand:+ start:938 stop:1567 length:630 start_codon:yes stop_codon:yes gene_type:complete
MINKIKKMVAGVAIAASMVCGTPSVANAGGSVEVMAGDKNTTLDTKVMADVAPRTKLFLRGRTSVDYQGEVSYFGLADLNVNLVDGLDAVAEAQFIPGVGVVPRLGLGYFKKVDDFSVYGLATAGFNGEDVDAEFLVNLIYKPQLTEDLNLVLNLENVTNIGEQGHNFSVQRLRTGLGIDNYEFGVAADLTEAGGEVTPNVGGYAKLSF